MTNTPETDSLIPQFLSGSEIPDVFALCRKLERERDEARKSLDEMSKYLAQVTAGRDHAETELCKMIDFSKSVLGERDEWCKCAEKLAAIIGAPDKPTWATDDEINEALRSELNGGSSKKDAAAKVAAKYGIQKRHVYELALMLK
jgi:hypothetical protein